MTTSTKSWKLSPSDFAFLWEECKRCFYLKVARGFYRPRTPFPGIFSVIDRLMNEYFNGRPNAEISDTLPPGVVKYGESWVESRPLSVPGHASTCFIRGRFDSVLEFEDGSYAVIDFKTTSTQSDHLHLYTRHLPRLRLCAGARRTRQSGPFPHYPAGSRLRGTRRAC